MGIKGRFLHVGCGDRELPEWAEGCDEVRLDIDPDVRVDVVASMIDMGDIGEFDVVYASHCLEHLYPHETSVALDEFYRVCKIGGCVIIDVPDLEFIKATRDKVYHSPSGDICGLDMIYGKASMLKECPYMAHHSGFVPDTLAEVMASAGFTRLKLTSVDHNLTGIGIKEKT